MDTLNKLFKKMDEIKNAASGHIQDCLDTLDETIKPFFDDHQGLQSALKALPDSRDYTWVFDGTEVASWVRLDLSDFKGDDDDRPCLIDALERYLENEETWCQLDQDQDCLFYPHGQSIIINDDGDAYDENLSLSGDGQWFLKSSEYTIEGESNELYRNQLIENHMEKTGCFPGVFTSDRHGNVYAVDTRFSVGADKCDYCETPTSESEKRFDHIPHKCSKCNARVREKHTIGVTSKPNNSFFELMNSDGVDLGYEEYQAEIEASDMSDEDKQDALDNHETDSSQWLVGDWKKDANGLYEIDYRGKHGFAATYSNANGNIVCVEYSHETQRCHHTSPCYVMADGSGPCGDLDTNGDSVLAYCLPECYTIDDED